MFSGFTIFYACLVFILVLFLVCSVLLLAVGFANVKLFFYCSAYSLPVAALVGLDIVSANYAKQKSVTIGSLGSKAC